MKRNLAAPNKGRSPVYQSSALRCRRKGEEKVIKAVILDFYGTIVAHGAVLGREKIAALWWPHFREQCDAAYGDSFCLQRDIYPKVFECMARETGAEGIDFEALRKRDHFLCCYFADAERCGKIFRRVPASVLYPFEYR